jgi:hypothetical protein
MPTFQISDPPPTVTLAEATENGRQIAKATVSFVVENKTSLKQAAVARVIPETSDDPGSYLIEGASPTMTTVRSVDFDPNGAQTVNVTITVPRSDIAKKGAFHLRVAKDTETDDDAVDSRPVAFETAAAAAAAKPKRPFPRWAAIAAGVIIVLGAGAVAWAAWPKYPSVEEIQRATVGRHIVEAIHYLERKGLSHTLAHDPASPLGAEIVHTTIVVDHDVTLVYDPGILLRSLIGERLSILQTLVPRFAGEATIHLIRESDDPNDCFDKIVNQSPLALSDVYEIGTKFVIFWRHGLSQDPNCEFERFNLDAFIDANRHVIVASQ